jgi:RNA polymerase sigma-70 factor (ECF subfamily)
MRPVHPEVPEQAPSEASPQDALRHADALFHLARYLTGNAGDAEDLVQETYARAYQAWSRLQPGSNIRSWLFRILRNTFVSEVRADRRHPAPDAETQPDDLPDLAASDGYVRGDIELDRMRRAVARDIEAALGALSPDGRTIVLLDLEGFTESELAEVLGCPVGTVKSRLSRARAALRQRLAQYRQEEER